METSFTVLTSSPAGAFVLELLAAGYVGLTSIQIPQVNDKFLHFIVFFVLALTFYWILDTTRRRTFNLTLSIVIVGLGVTSELLQAFLPNGRQFDPLDIAANVVGSGGALGLCTLYHRRMLERKRRRKGYGPVAQEGQEDVELGEQETGVTDRAEEGEDNEAWDDLDAASSPAAEVLHDTSKANGADDKT